MTSTNNPTNVAVAGVTSGLGYAIATALVTNPALRVTLLTRHSPGESLPEILQNLARQGATIRQVDYTSILSITDALRGVHTVISTVNVCLDMSAGLNLLEGAKAAGVQRFAPSEFSIAKEANSTISFYKAKSAYFEEVKKSGMECTAFRNGMFMDYFAKGSPKYDGLLRMYPFFVDVENRKAEIPGTGNELLTVTTLADIGKFVSEAVTLNSWPEEMGMSGKTLSVNDIVRAAEEVIGEKFEVKYVSEGEFKNNQAKGIKEKNSFMQLLAELYLAYISGEAEIKDPYLNKMTSIQPMKVKEFLQKYW